MGFEDGCYLRINLIKDGFFGVHVDIFIVSDSSVDLDASRQLDIHFQPVSKDYKNTYTTHSSVD